ncbi:MAG: type II CRISPR-associated endonuclease Cas1 [Lachnospiraceae bacterium]|nr:type II CRISPR-associated endonuclease Cas1 [Lachnospiraceae bacterium]
MSWRTVIISRRCKLDYKMGYLVVRGDDIQKVFLDEIAILLVEDPAVALTGCLIEALSEKKIKTIFCDSKKSPIAELVSHHGSHDSSLKIRTQFAWPDHVKAVIWQEIVSEKIRKQSCFLEEIGKERESALLRSYIGQVQGLDASNREGHAAKVYFNALFGMNFTRSADNVINAALNYGYSLILSSINRVVTSAGYLTQLGVFHNNMFNHFNLSCDLMEPYRVLVDRYVYNHHFCEFGTDEKHAIWGILNQEVLIDTKIQTVMNAIKVFTYSVFDAINDQDASKILHYQII